MCEIDSLVLLRFYEVEPRGDRFEASPASQHTVAKRWRRARRVYTQRVKKSEIMMLRTCIVPGIQQQYHGISQLQRWHVPRVCI